MWLLNLFKSKDSYSYQLPASNYVFKFNEWPFRVFRKQAVARWKVKYYTLRIQGTEAGNEIITC